MNDIAASTDSYFTMLFSYAVGAPMTLLAAFFLCLARILPIMVMVPFFGAKNVPNIAKMMFAVALVAIILPQIMISLTGTLELNVAFMGFALKELVFGFILGFLATIPFYVAQSAGGLIDHIRGSSSLQVNDPSTQTKTGPIGILYNYVLIVIFFAVGGPFIFLDVLSRSFQIVPVNDILNPIFFTLKASFWKVIISLLSHLLAMAIQLGAPSIIGVLMAEMFLGIANRLAPQVQIVFLGISLKSFVGLALLAAAWFFILKQLGKESLIWLKYMNETMQQLSPIIK